MFNIRSMGSSSPRARCLAGARPKRRGLGGALVGVIALGPAVIARAGVAPPNYTLTDLGTLPGFNSSSALAINNAGQVVGSAGPSGNTQAFLYTGGATQAIAGAGTNSVAAGINSSGQVVGYSSAGAFLYTGGTAQPLSGMAQAVAINDNGQIAGASNSSVAPFVYASLFSNGVVQQLSPANITYAAASAINSSGQVLWNGTDSLVNIGWVYANGKSQSAAVVGANAINDSGQIAGQGATGLGYRGMPYHAALTSVGSGQFQDLGTLGGSNSDALGINNAGQVVGNSDIANGNPTTDGFLYVNGRMYDLNNLVSGDSGYVITSAVAINASGQIAADAITPSGETHAVLLSPAAVPLPPAAWIGLATLGLVTGGMARRRRAEKSGRP